MEIKNFLLKYLPVLFIKTCVFSSYQECGEGSVRNNVRQREKEGEKKLLADNTGQWVPH